MKKRFIYPLTLSLMLSALSASITLKAEDYSDTSYWMNKCTQVQTSDEGIRACEGFQEYQKAKKDDLKGQIENFSSSISEVKENISEMEKLAASQRELSESINREIAQAQDTINELAANIADTNRQIDEVSSKIDQKEKEIRQREDEIEVWDDQIRSRMKSEQSYSGTNSYIDLVMGSSSLADMLRRISGIERITQSDQDQIYDLNQLKNVLEKDKSQLELEKSDLEFMRSDLSRLKENEEEQKAQLEEQKQQADELEASYQALVEEYQKKQSELEAQLRSAQQDMSALRDFVISSGLSDALDFDSIPSASGFLTPVPGYRKSAGTWAYNGGGIHLGLDMAAAVGNNLLAPISGLVIYTSNTQPTNSGYLGNWSGAPAGSGNCIEMVGQVNGTTYAVAFFHLSNEFYVSPGSQVTQGQVLAKTGNSGNSTGAHTHMEVYNLGSMSMQDAVSYFQRTGDWAFQTGWGTTSTACEYKGSTPCRERPESLL